MSLTRSLAPILLIAALSGSASPARCQEEEQPAAPADEEQKDVAGSKDHPLASRLPGYLIGEYTTKDFDTLAVYGPDGKELTVEGKRTTIYYVIKEGQQAASCLQIIRNYQNAFKKLGGALVYQDPDSTLASLKLVKGGQEAWLYLACWSGGEQYTLEILEKQEMKQDVTSEWKQTLDRDGRLTLHINFDTAKATLRPDAQPTIAQIIALLQGAPDLKLSIEGHTDSVGDPKSNKALSESRAKTVMDAVVRGGIDAARLSAAGYGQEKPVADNSTEEGRAKNRRVELVKK
jgi:OOP family OmpA-OmpF porin